MGVVLIRSVCDSIETIDHSYSSSKKERKSHEYTSALWLCTHIFVSILSLHYLFIFSRPIIPYIFVKNQQTNRRHGSAQKWCAHLSLDAGDNDENT
jgi:hypothetical protein